MASAAPTTLHPATERIRSYFAAYHRGDSVEYAAQWTYPACLHSDGRWSVVPDAATMARNNDDYARAQHAAGAVAGEILALDTTEIGAGAALVRGRFARLRADGSRLDDVAASYLVVRVTGPDGEAAWKVAVCLTGR
jgi:hypothetical protein